MTWAEQINHFLAAAKISQARFAREVGVSNATVNRWAKGHKEPSQLVQVGVLAKMANLYPEAAWWQKDEQER